MENYYFNTLSIQQKRKILFRYLKENNIFIPFLRNSTDKKLFNAQMYMTIGKDSLLDVLANKSYEYQNIISSMFIWSKTKEGYDFWQNMSINFKNYLYDNVIKMPPNMTKKQVVSLLKSVSPNPRRFYIDIPRDLGYWHFSNPLLRLWEWNDFNEDINYTTEDLFKNYCKCVRSWD